MRKAALYAAKPHYNIIKGLYVLRRLSRVLICKRIYCNIIVVHKGYLLGYAVYK